jgi:cell division protein FtsQ
LGGLLLAALSPAPVLVAATVGAVSFVFLSDAGRATRTAVPLSEHLDRLVLAAGFGIEQVSLTGHRFTTDSAIFDTLDLGNVRSMLRFDAIAVRERMERLPWIAGATITRVFPDRLEVRIRERTPFALWQRGEREYLIDATGRVLSAVTAGSVTHLPRVIGEGAAVEARALLAELARHPQVSGRLEAVERVGERRWTLRLTGGQAVHLPAEGWEEALARLADPALADRALAPGVATVDLRGRGATAIRSHEAASTPTGRGP